MIRKKLLSGKVGNISEKVLQEWWGSGNYKNLDPNSNRLAIRQVVVKEVKSEKGNYKYDLATEAAHRVAILQGGSNHIVGLTHHPRAIRAQDEDMEPE